MNLVLATAFGAVVWVVVWALSGKGFDAMLLFIAIMLIAILSHITQRYLPGARRGSDD